MDRFTSPLRAAGAGLEYLLFGTGILASNVCDGGGFWNANESEAAPDTQFHFLPGTGLEHGLRKIRNGVTLNTAWLRPGSRSVVRLRSRDPLAPPHIDPNYWRERDDVRRSIAGFRLGRRIMAQPRSGRSSTRTSIRDAERQPMRTSSNTRAGMRKPTTARSERAGWVRQ